MCVCVCVYIGIIWCDILISLCAVNIVGSTIDILIFSYAVVYIRAIK
jgi:hypothetical protein